MRVLIVEDEASLRMLFSELVAERGHEVIAVPDAESALIAFERDDPPLIISDWQMSGMTGVDLCRLIRARPHGGEPFILLVTGRDKMSDLEAALNAGADDFVVKPTTPNAFRMRVAIAERSITQRQSKRRADTALIASEQRFAAVFRKSPAAISLIRAEDFVFLDVNDAFCKFFGAARENVVGYDARSLTPMLDPDFIGTVGAMPVGGALVATLRRPDDSPVEMLLAVEVVELSGRLCWLATMIDVTERERLRSQLLLADRMASVGTLAAGVAHEINNPLAYVIANLEFVASELARTPKNAARDTMIEALEEAQQGGERVKAIVRDLKTFSRTDSDEIAAVDLHAVIESAINLVKNEIRHRARLDRDFAEIPKVRGHAGRLGQVFVNLLANAAQAITEGDAGKNLISVRTGVDQDGMVFVTIADTGCGIPPENVARVFDPFFTTKPVGEGTGLGLSICHALVMSFGGHIVVDSEVGLGSIFLVTLPAAGVEAARVKGVAPTKSASGARRGRILVIDDEVMIVRSLLRVLHHDHDVDTVTSAREGLERLESGQSYDLILCDLMMPDMTGMDLHAELRARHRALLEPIVFLTGGAFTQRAKQFLETAETPWIEKPVDMRALRELIQKRLDAKNLASTS